MITIEDISHIQLNILKRMADQVEHGQQSKTLIQRSAYACGQFVNKAEKHQRGAHGSAAALLVISQAYDGNQNKELIAGLINYLQNRLTLETEAANLSRAKRDDQNVIKICEILFALSFVKPGMANKETYLQNLYGVLIHNIIDGKGWGYFLGSNEVRKLLPTAFAIVGLGSAGYTVTNSIRNIEEVLDKDLKKPVNDPTQFAKYVFCNFALTYSKEILDRGEKQKYKGHFKKLFKSQLCNLNKDLEQNFEYWSAIDDSQHEYIRIPWQLYLVSTAVKLSPWYFSKIKMQRILKNIQLKSLNGGFKYNHSGPYLSTRTQAIIFDILSKIKGQLNKQFQYKLYNGVDWALSFFRSKGFRFFLMASIVLVFIISVIDWISDADRSLADLGPEAVAAVLFCIYAWSSRSFQK